MKVLRTIHALLVLGIVFVTASYARGAVRGYVPGSLNDSEAAVTANIVETVTVMMDLDQGPATYRATGFLHSFSSDTPSDDLVVPLKPRMFRLHADETWDCYPRVKQLGAKVQLVVSDSYGYAKWPGYNQYQSAWERTIADLVAQADSSGFTDIEWDIWNEPNYWRFWGASTQQFYDTWEIGYRKLRSLKPGAVIVGPSSTGSIQYVKDFLLFAKGHHFFHRLNTEKPGGFNILEEKTYDSPPATAKIQNVATIRHRADVTNRDAVAHFLQLDFAHSFRGHHHASRISATLPAMVCSRSRAWALRVSSSSFSVSSCSLKSSSLTASPAATPT